MNIKTRLCSSLAKIFPDQEPDAVTYSSAMVLQGETFSFQLAYHVELDATFGGSELKAEIDSPLKKQIRIRKVDYVPIRNTVLASDENVISKKAGLYPDVLTPLESILKPGGYFNSSAFQWESLWITVEVPSNCKAGKYPITLKIHEETKPVTFMLEVLNARIPAQKLIHTEWFHADCLAVYYKVDMWSEEHWQIVSDYMKSAVKHGINMILTPVFTPPLDTAVGGERPTTQLVGVTVKKGKYSFDLSRLERWIDIAQKAGVEYFEISHLYTQWGAEFTPKIVAAVDGKEKRIFGWDVKSSSKKYKDFLSAFLPELTAFLTARNLKNNTYFHCSDEPGVQHIATYKPAVEFLRKYLNGFKICDALSSIDFYKEGLVTTPIPAEDHIEPFIENDVPERWTYYCCGQWNKVSNRFINMPSSRNRVMGALLYRYDIAGFLQWGFNFYYAQLSLFPIDPYATVDSNYIFPPGDAFMVYPGQDGKPVDSIHYEVFAEALQDLRALRLLESKVGSKKINAMLDKVTPGGKMTMTEYPRGEKAVLDLRKKVNEMLKKAFA